jgi:phosphoribosylamine---glycine ligase
MSIPVEMPAICALHSQESEGLTYDCWVGPMAHHKQLPASTIRSRSHRSTEIHSMIDNRVGTRSTHEVCYCITWKTVGVAKRYPAGLAAPPSEEAKRDGLLDDTQVRRVSGMQEQKTNLLILGSGSREHALARICAKSPSIGKLFVAPGNPGCASVAKIVPLSSANHSQVIAFCQREAIDLVVVGPEAPLVLGLVDELVASGVSCFGPTRAAARLEGSKGYAKDFCREFGIPTGDYQRFQDPNEAKAYIRRRGAPIVIKADGLAAGKGVVVASTIEEAEVAVDVLLFAERPIGAEIVIEEFLEGEEVSFFALCDGRVALPFASAQDHKRLAEGDIGPNTGGMGAYSPPKIMTTNLSQRIMREIVAPTLRGMKQRGAPFKGVLFVGLMVGERGPKVIEFNVRFGDPEAQVILPRLNDDLVPFLIACANGTLQGDPPQFCSDTAVAVVMAARGYPGEPLRGSRIRGMEDGEAAPGVVVFHGATREVDASIFADGGRVLTVTALGGDVASACARAYAAIIKINWPEGFFRRDIGWRAMN